MCAAGMAVILVKRRAILSDIEKAAAEFLGRDPEVMEVALYLEHLLILRDQLGNAIDAVRSRFRLLLDEAGSRVG